MRKEVPNADIRMAMAKYGIKPKELAEASGYSYIYVYNLINQKNGKTSPYGLARLRKSIDKLIQEG